MGRLSSLDAMRGLIIVIMAIDHARGFIARNHPSEWWGRALPNYQGDALAFLTRLVTHLCAPGFFFLLGAGMALLAASRAQVGWSSGRIIRFFVLRGAAIALLAQVFENGAVSFGSSGATRSFGYGIIPPGIDGSAPVVLLIVLYALGTAMILGSPLWRHGPGWLVGAAVACELVVQWLVPPASQVNVRFHPLMRLLFIPGQSGWLFVVYPTVAWLPCTLLGMAFGKSLIQDRDRAFQRLAVAGALFLGLFVAVRATGGFGDITPSPGGWIGFFNVVKYPPSLTFVLLTLGVDFLLLFGIERWRVGDRAFGRVLIVFGAVPFFFYVTHLWLYGAMGKFFPAGIPIAWMYPFWLLGVVLLYVPCRWYGAFKQRRPPGSFFRML